MKSSDVVNFYDLAILREVIPFLRLRYRTIRRQGREIDGTRNRDVLIVAPCIVGDCLSCLPAIEAFAGEAQISYDIVVSPDFQPLAERLRSVRNVFVASSSYKRVTERHADAKQDVPSEYDLIVVLRLSPGAMRLIKDIRYWRLISSDILLTKYIVKVARSSLSHRPVIQARSVMYEVFGLTPAPAHGHPPTLFTGCIGDYDRLARISAVQGREKKVLIHPGSGWQVKLWSDDRWVGLLNCIHAAEPCRFIFIGRGPIEKATFDRIQKRLDFRLYSLIDVLNLWELFLVMERCDAFIGIDSGPRNLAHLADLRSVTLLNPAAVNNFMPFDDRDVVVAHPNRFPANLINTKRGANLSQIGVNEVFKAYMKLSSCKPEIVNTAERQAIGS